MKLFLFLLGVLASINVYAGLQYSEYYQNPSAKFKGTIVFENGSGTDLDEWKANPNFFNCIKRLGSVFLYDRSGLGKSSFDEQISNVKPITAKSVSSKLEKLLIKENIKPPYIIVAHSYGAVYAGYFILTHPDLIKGVILVDPVGREFEFSKSMQKQYDTAIKLAKSRSVDFISKKYDPSKTEVIYQLLGLNESIGSLKQLGSIKDTIPVIVISSTQMEKRKPLKQDWYDSQKQWLNQNNSSRIIRTSSGHFIQVEKPNLVCAAIKELTL